MKHLFFALTATMMLAACCHKTTDSQLFQTTHMEGKQFLMHEAMEPDESTMYVENTFSIVWPAEGQMSDDDCHTLLTTFFGDSTATDLTEASQRWLNNMWVWDQPELKGLPVNAIPDTIEYTYMHMDASCRQDSNLVTFLVKSESYSAGAAHGLYSAQYLTYDLQTRRFIHLADLMDTTLLGEALAHAVQDLDVNADVRNCLYDEYTLSDRLPLPESFVIDSTRSTVTAMYSLYDITPYACGIPAVVLPIYWLSKHTPLTPYARQLFGPGCSIQEVTQ